MPACSSVRWRTLVGSVHTGASGRLRGGRRQQRRGMAPPGDPDSVSARVLPCPARPEESVSGWRGRQQGKDVPHPRVTVSAEHRGVSGFDRIRPHVTLDHQPRRRRVADLADEGMPSL